MNFRPLALALLLAGALVPGVALAQQVSDGDKAAARQLTLDGLTALQRRDYAGAAGLLSRADALYHAPTITLGLARAHAGLGKLLVSQEYYQRLVHETLPPSAPEAFTRAIEDGRAELAALSPRIPSVVIQVQGAVAAKVTLDGVEVPAAVLGARRPVDPGRHTIRAVARGFTPAVAAASVAEGRIETVTLTFVPAPPGTSDGVDDASAGSSGGSVRKTIGFAGLGVGAAGLAVGAIAGGLAVSKHASLVQQCPMGRCLSSQQAGLGGDVSTYHTLTTVSTAGLVVGGVLAATGVILVLTAPRTQTQTAVSPMVGPGFAGLGAGGRF